jgi:serine/threonine-protein kinase RsbW
MGVLSTPIELTFPADERFVRLARVLASGVAMACGLPLDEIEDLRLAVDEVCATLVESAGGPVKVVFSTVGGSLIFEASSQAPPAGSGTGVARQALADHVLGLLADEHRRHDDADRLRFVISTRLRAGGVG